MIKKFSGLNGDSRTGHFRKRSLKRAFPVPRIPLESLHKHPMIIIRIPLVLHVQEEWEDLYARVKKLILRLEIIIYADKTKTSPSFIIENPLYNFFP